MPPERNSKAPGPKPFKVPRPASSSTVSKSKTSNAKSKSKSTSSNIPTSHSNNGFVRASIGEISSPNATDPSDADDAMEEDNENDEQEIDALEATQDSESTKIPKELLKRILHEFAAEKVGEEASEKPFKLSKMAAKAVEKYMDVFVREAIVRAVVERRETDEKEGLAGFGGGFLEVEDLEKLAPQLLLDF